MSDQALADGSAERMLAALNSGMAKAVNGKFARALAARKRKDASVAAGREYVEAYVNYTHYVEALHAVIAGAGGHGEHHE